MVKCKAHVNELATFKFTKVAKQRIQVSTNLELNLYFVQSFPEIDLKVASKFFGGRFACGSSVTGEDEIVIQGDVKDDLFDVLVEKWPQVI